MAVMKRMVTSTSRMLLVMPLLLTLPSSWFSGGDGLLMFARAQLTPVEVSIFNIANFKARYSDFADAAAYAAGSYHIWKLASGNLVLTPDSVQAGKYFTQTVNVEAGHELEITALSGVQTLTRSPPNMPAPYGDAPTFMVYDQGSLTFRSIIITSVSSGHGSAVYVASGGLLVLEGTTFLNCYSSGGSGGAIFSAGGTINATDAIFDGCSAPKGNGGAIAVTTAEAVGASSSSSSSSSNGGSVMLVQVSFSGCSASSGGAISLVGSSSSSSSVMISQIIGAKLMGCSFQMQNASNLGGDVYVQGYTQLDVDASSFGVPGATSRAASGGCVYASGSTTSLTLSDSSFQSCEALESGGGLAMVDAVTCVLNNCEVLDGNVVGDDGDGGDGDGGEGVGGALFVGGTASVTANNLRMANTHQGSQGLTGLGRSGVHPGRCDKDGIGSGCGRKTWRGGGIFAQESAQVSLTALSCHSLDASGDGACLFATGAAAVSVIGATVNSTTNSSRAISLVDLDSSAGPAFLADMNFADNKRGSLHLSGSSAELILNKASFTGDTVSTPDAHGGSVRVDRGALLRGANLTARGNVAGEDGGWLYASAATVELVDVLLDANQALTGKGGGVFGESMLSLKLQRATVTNNAAMNGGGLYARSCAKNGRFLDANLFFGVQLYDSAFKSNRARLGGGISGESSFLFARDTEFTDNVNVGTNAKGSAAAFAPDAVYERCLFKNPEVDGNIYEQDGNSTLVEGERLVLDSSVFNITTSKSSPLSSSSSSASVSSAASPSSREGSQGVIAVRLNNDTGGSFSGMGKGDGSRIGGSFYTLLSRNTDLAGLRIVGQPREKMMDSSLSSQQGGGARGFGSAAYQASDESEGESWDWKRCDHNAEGHAQESYLLTATLPNSDTYMPQIWSTFTLRYDPVCPPDATCTDDDAARTIRCVCPSATSAFPTVNNELHQCQTYSPTTSPSMVPTEAKVTTSKPTPAPKVLLTNYTLSSDNPYLTIDLMDLVDQSIPTELVPVAYAFFGISVLVLGLGLLVNIFKFRGMTGAERQGWVLSTMYSYPGHFQYMLLVDREEYVGELMNAEQREIERDLARRMAAHNNKRSMSFNSMDGGPGDLFRGASYDRSFDGGSLFRSGSFERGMSFDSVGKSRGAGGGGGGSFDGGAGNESQLEESKQPLNASDLVLEKSRNPMGGTLTAAL